MGSMSHRQIYRTIGEQYGCTAENVRYWLVPGNRKADVNHIGLSKKDYDNLYKRVSRRLPDYLYRVFGNKDKRFTMNGISDNLSDLVGIFFMPKTIKNLVKRYEDDFGYQPLMSCGGRNGAASYGLSMRFYSRYKKRSI